MSDEASPPGAAPPSNTPTEVGVSTDSLAAPLGAPPGGDLEARRARGAVARGLFGDSGEDPPTKVGRYELHERLGAGGMGMVFRATDPQLQRDVAIKVLALGNVDEDARRRLVREARALAQLSHPNVVAVHDVGEDEGEVFVAMELVRGHTLRDWIAEPRTWREVLRIYLAAAEGLRAAHDAGLAHRDFKPDNAIVGDDGRVRVLDFGLARPALGQAAVDDAVTRTGAAVGTPAYMAPEQYDGVEPDPRSDQWSFCVALYEALYGQRPFSGTTLASWIRDAALGKVASPPEGEVPEAMYDVLTRGLSPRPGARFPDMGALIGALQAAETAVVAGAPKGGGSGRAPFLIGASLVVVAAAAVVGLELSSAPVSVAEERAHLEAAPEPTPSPDPSADERTTEAMDIEAPTTALAPDEPPPEPEAGTTDADIEPAPGEKTAAPKPKDHCHMEEDTYRLLERGPRRRATLQNKGRCLACARERRKAMIQRFNPSDCDAYYVCRPDEEACS